MPDAHDAPLVVVQQQVVVFAEQDAVIHVSSAVISHPFIGVVGFAPRGWSVAAGPDAASVAGGEGDALATGEQAHLPAEVEHVALGAEEDRLNSRLADESLGRRGAHRLGLAFEVGGAGARLEVGQRHEQLGRRSTGPDEGRHVGLRAEAEQLHDGVEGELLGRARVGEQGIHLGDRVGIDEPRAAEAR